MKTQHISHMRIIFLSILCIAVGAIAGGAYERSNRLSNFDEVLGLLVHSCINERSYDELLQRLDVEPLKIGGSSGTDFEKIHGDGKGQPFVVTIDTDEDGEDLFYELEYEVVEGVNGFLIERDRGGGGRVGSARISGRRDRGGRGRLVHRHGGCRSEHRGRKKYD